MVGTILVVLSEGFDDMAYLSTQVILEESGNDVISVSPSGGAVKGNTSSVMTVGLDTALDQELDYKALVLIGGSDFTSINGITDLVNKFVSSGKIIAAFGSGVDVLNSSDASANLSSDGNIVVDNNIYSLKVPEDCEDFVEKLAENI